MEELLDLSKLGYREAEEAGKLLLAYTKSRPDNWYDEGVKLAFNSYNGNVFLLNDDYQVLMLNGDKAEIYYSLSCDGYEGFIEDLYDDFRNGNIDERNYDQLADYLEAENMTAEAEEVRQAIRDLKHEEEL